MRSLVEDFAEEQYGSLPKRSRFEAAPPSQHLISHDDGFAAPPSVYNPLDEPSPLGLRLRKTPSLLDLIQMRLTQATGASALASSSGVCDSGKKKDAKANTALSANDKLKAANFPASLLRIGTWEYVSTYEGDLVAKCYFAKHKLVWEVLEDGLKSKLEIQWSDITALKTEFPENGPGSLTILLARKPVFFRETNPQPRKHTLWQASSDFTDGQASINLKHYIECPPGVLNKHYERLIQCDLRLYHLSLQPELVMNSPCLESQASVPEISEESKGDRSIQMLSAKEFPLPVCQDMSSSGTYISSVKSHQNLLPEQLVSEELSSPSSANDEQSSGAQNSVESRKIPGLYSSMSMNDLVNHIESCISKQRDSGILPSDKASECHDMLDNISQVLLSDTPGAPVLDENSLMKKVNSLCCLLQDPTIAPGAQGDGESSFEVTANLGKNLWDEFTTDFTNDKASSFVTQADEDNFIDGPVVKPATSIPRRDSFSDLLVHLPSIASLPKFPKLFGISENDEYHPL